MGEGSNVDRLYKEAEEVRLKTPPPSPRHLSVTENLSLKSGITDAKVQNGKVPLVTGSLLFPGLVVDEKARTRPKSKHRSNIRVEKTRKIPSCATPTTASHTHVAPSPRVAG